MSDKVRKLSPLEAQVSQVEARAFNLTRSLLALAADAVKLQEHIDDLITMFKRERAR